MTQVEIQELPIDAPQESVQEEVPQELAHEQPEPHEEPEPQEAPAPQEEPTPPKRKRGRPPGSKNVKEPKAKPPPKAAPKAKGKAKPAAPPSSDEESLPQYVQQSLPPRPQDFATQLFGLLQDHERERAGRRRATYAAWLSRF